MKADTSLQSLLKPGEHRDFFSNNRAKPIQINTACFSLSNAWWMAEASRLIYRPDFYKDNKTETGALSYKLIRYIEDVETSTHIALLKVLQDAPCLIVVFRGSDEIKDWGINVRVYQNNFIEQGKVHRGFKKAYLSIRDPLLAEFDNNDLPVFITGHSLGAALAVLASSELYKQNFFDSCYTFGSPRIGNPEFVHSIQSNSIYRIINNSDVVTTIPIDFANINYHHVGKALLIDENGNLHKEMNEDSIYDYQKNKLKGLKTYAIEKLVNNKLDTIKDDLPSFLADHAPINYVTALSNLLKKD